MRLMYDNIVIEGTVDEVLDFVKGKADMGDDTMLDDNFFYEFMFDDENPNYSTNADYNRLFLASKEKYLNDILRLRGVVTLYKCLSVLGVEPSIDDPSYTHMTQYGYVYSEKIDFGLDDPDNKDFIDGKVPYAVIKLHAKNLKMKD